MCSRKSVKMEKISNSNKSAVFIAKRSLENSLGDDWQKYLSHLRLVDCVMIVHAKISAWKYLWCNERLTIDSAVIAPKNSLNKFSQIFSGNSFEMEKSNNLTARSAAS